MIKPEIVSIFKTADEYPDLPFNPDKKYLEFDNFFLYKINTQKNNSVYEAVRESLYQLGLDQDNYNTQNWNPFKEFVKEGNNVVIKPNLVFDNHPFGKEGVLSMISHASVIRPIIDYILLATNGNVNITVCDVPLQSADWERLIRQNGIKELVEFYKTHGIKIDLLDLRYEIAIPNKERYYYKRIKRIRDPKGYVKIDLGKKSYIQDIIKDYKKLEITDYGLGTVSKHHNYKKNEYLIPKTILDSDVFINIPKLKTHRKAGVTLSMKNLIGINGDKSWIAHHRRGIDEYPEFKLMEFLKWRINYYMKIYMPAFFNTFIRKMYRILFLKGNSIKKHGALHGGSTMEGNWYGNDTVWRTILDLNNILFFADKNGKMRNKKQRKYLSIIDGIIGMEKEGPMEGYPKRCGIIIGGFHPVAVDYIASYVMGFDYNRIPKIREGFREKYYGLTKFKKEDVKVKSNLDWKTLNLKFIASKGWRDHIER